MIVLHNGMTWAWHLIDVDCQCMASSPNRNIRYQLVHIGFRGQEIIIDLRLLDLRGGINWIEPFFFDFKGRD